MTMTTDELSRLWELLPTDIVDSIGIGDLAASMGLSVDRTLELLTDLVPRGARCCRGDRVGNMLRFNCWWRELDHE
jgi:hypothetical protein